MVSNDIMTDEWRRNVVEYEISMFRNHLWDKYDLDIHYSDEDFQGPNPPWKKLFFVASCHNCVCSYLEAHPEVEFRSIGARYYDILLLASMDLFDMIGEQ